MNICDELPETLRKENGGGPPPNGFGFVCIWRPGIHNDDDARYGVTVEEFLSRPENFNGRWLIDGGWGGPPGPIMVEWIDGHWVSHGFPPHPNEART